MSADISADLTTFAQGIANEYNLQASNNTVTEPVNDYQRGQVEGLKSVLQALQSVQGATLEVGDISVGTKGDVMTHSPLSIKFRLVKAEGQHSSWFIAQPGSRGDGWKSSVSERYTGPGPYSSSTGGAYDFSNPDDCKKLISKVLGDYQHKAFNRYFDSRGGMNAYSHEAPKDVYGLK